jgi:hypothetical protein
MEENEMKNLKEIEEMKVEIGKEKMMVNLSMKRSY